MIALYSACGAESRTSAVQNSPMLLGAFRPPKPDNTICCDTHSMVMGTSFHAL